MFKTDRTMAIAAVALAIALALGAGLRVFVLDRVPLGFNQDEACNGYDAYSILTTGHDHHGNLLPIVAQGFNDYRMALFDYSIAPLVGLFGLNPSAVRMGAALWGIADLIAIAFLAAELIDLRAAPIAVILAALSPWHLMMSRLGLEVTAAAATVDWATACFIFAVKRRREKWLIASALLFGISLYSYSTTKLFTPLMIGWLAILYWRELRSMARSAAAAAAAFALAALPQAWLFASRSAEMAARLHQRSFLDEPGWMGRFATNWLDHFRPDFMFGNGDWLFLHPHELVLMYPAQALMAAAGAAMLLLPDYRRKALQLIGWLAVAAMPGAMLTPGSSPHPLHDFLLISPWAILAALGAVGLIDLPYWKREGGPAEMRGAGVAIAGTVMLLALIQGAGTAGYYFTEFPAEKASIFQYGAEELIRNAERLAAPGEPIVIPLTLNQPYIYVLFFDAYPPRRFFSEPVTEDHRLFGQVLAFDRYRFGDPWEEFQKLPHGVFIFPKTLERPFDNPPPPSGVHEYPTPPAPPVMTLHFGREAYSIVVK